jgi:hypothetical protein
LQHVVGLFPPANTRVSLQHLASQVAQALAGVSNKAAACLLISITKKVEQTTSLPVSFGFGHAQPRLSVIAGMPRVYHSLCA